MIQATLLHAAIVAALTGLLLDSPIGELLRWWAAGLPPSWAIVPGHKARHPWLATKMECLACVSFWVAGAVTMFWWWNAGDTWFVPFFWAMTWLGGRLILGLARMIEYHGGD